ncbi:DUF6314 family protein [Bosea psychrotolerans]|uniref:DUF6314 family protein n=1 Tax=Bosea psychrotolerans TaxID=1871628 RepID=UPI003CCC40D0
MERLAGKWLLSRHISPGGRMEGFAEFARTEGGVWLRYHEQGELVLDSGRRLRATRSFLFRALNDGFSVHFDDERASLFQEVYMTQVEALLIGEANHQCLEDRYSSVYEFSQGGTFSILHTVRGPRKDYTSRTSFRRA